MMADHQLRESEDKYEELLGCKIEGNLKWHRQAGYLASKLRKRISGLAQIKFLLPFRLRRVVTESIFNSVLGYCLPVFGW